MHAWAVALYTALFGLGLAVTATFAVVQSLRSGVAARSEVAALAPSRRPAEAARDGGTAWRRSSAVSALERAVLESVAYSDVFDFPVTAEEIRRSLPVAASLSEVEAVLAAASDSVTVSGRRAVLRPRGPRGAGRDCESGVRRASQR